MSWNKSEHNNLFDILRMAGIIPEYEERMQEAYRFLEEFYEDETGRKIISNDKEFLNKLLRFFEEIEEYEKCQKILSWKKE